MLSYLNYLLRFGELIRSLVDLHLPVIFCINFMEELAMNPVRTEMINIEIINKIKACLVGKEF